jgi:peptidoglycan/LPS O-acetylase OafA/YrhL
MSMSRSSVALNNLRGFAIINVLAFHSFIAYLGSQPSSAPPFDKPQDWMANPIVDSARWFGFDLYCALQYVYLMYLMFFLSGLFVWPSLERKGAKAFLLDRFLRLGLPFLIGVYLLMPATYYATYRVTAADPSWSAFWSQWLALPMWPNGPMWFLSSLLAFNVVAAGLFQLAPRVGKYLGQLSADADLHPIRYFLKLAFVSGLAYFPLAAVYQPWEWVDIGPFGFQASLILQYFVFFLASLGIGAYGFERGLLAADGLLARHWNYWLIGALAAFILWIVPTAIVTEAGEAAPFGMQAVADLGLVLSSAACCFGVLAVFLRFFSGTFSPILNSLAENAYGIYFVHYIFVIWLQYFLLDAPLPAIVKAALVFGLTLALSWAVTVALCRIPFGARVIRGQQRLKARASSSAKPRYSQAEVSK